MGPHYHSRHEISNRKVAGLIIEYPWCWTSDELYTAVLHANINTDCLFERGNLYTTTGDCDSLFVLWLSYIAARKQFLSITVFNPFMVQWSTSGSLPTGLLEEKEPKTTTNATTGFSYQPYFLWRKEMYFTSWRATRERTHARGWVGRARWQAGRIRWRVWRPTGISFARETRDKRVT